VSDSKQFKIHFKKQIYSKNQNLELHYTTLHYTNISAANYTTIE